MVEELPLITVLSFLTTPYGAWHFDLVVLLLPILQVASRLTVADASGSLKPYRVRAALIAYAFIEIGMVVLAVSGWPSFVFAWVAPAIGLAWWLLPKQTVQAPALVPA